MKNTHDSHDDETWEERLFAFAYLLCLLHTWAGLAGSRRRCAVVGHAAPYLFFFGGVLRASDTHARVSKEALECILGDLLLVGHWISGIGVCNLFFCDCLLFAVAFLRPTTPYDIYTRPDK